VTAAKKNHALLATMPLPTREQAKAMVVATAKKHGVDPALALAISYQESGWNQRSVSVANAIGIMQVIPASGDWASSMVGRELNLLDAQDNVTAGVVIIRALQRATGEDAMAIAGYYQGLSSVRKNGMYSDTRAYVRTIEALRVTFS
jgi:soluble lytic murein transglycosylase-like protein